MLPIIGLHLIFIKGTHVGQKNETGTLQPWNPASVLSKAAAFPHCCQISTFTLLTNQCGKI